MVVEKIKSEKGKFWYNFINVRKLMSRHCNYLSHYSQRLISIKVDFVYRRWILE